LTIIEGESLFNDGAAGSFYQTFLAFVLLAVQGQPITGVQAWLIGIPIFLLEAGGGVLVGIVCGFLLSRLVKLIDDPLIETTLTILTAYGVYFLADTLHTSGILAVILAALLLGSYGRKKGMSERTQETIDNFWSVIAFVANALLFLLVGLQLNRKEFVSSGPLSSLLITAGLAIISVLLSRLIVVLMLPRSILPATGTFLASWRFVVFWSGLRGALSLALVLALPSNVPSHDALVVSTYAVVLFTLLVQGFSLRAILRHLPPAAQ
jgi:CPA1 family monovalent cation:H+ antiporter